MYLFSTNNILKYGLIIDKSFVVQRMDDGTPGSVGMLSQLRKYTNPQQVIVC